MNIKGQITSILKETYNIPVNIIGELFDFEIINEYSCKKYLIRKEWGEKCGFVSRTDLKIRLAEKYCVSISTIEKYVA